MRPVKVIRVEALDPLVELCVLRLAPDEREPRMLETLQVGRRSYLVVASLPWTGHNAPCVLAKPLRPNLKTMKEQWGRPVNYAAD